MNYLLDTNAWIDYLRNPGQSKVATRLRSMNPSSIYGCSIVRGELVYGAERSAKPQDNLIKVRQLLAQFVSLPFDDVAAEAFAKHRFDLERQGIMPGANDVMLAAIATTNQITLVSHNTKHFACVTGLMLEDWQS